MVKEQNNLDYIPKVGDIVEVWNRDTPRHKYWLELSFVQILRIVKEENDDGKKHYHVSVKTSDSFTKSHRNGGKGINGATSFQTCGADKWDRAFVKIGHMPVKTDRFNPPKKRKTK